MDIENYRKGNSNRNYQQNKQYNKKKQHHKYKFLKEIQNPSEVKTGTFIVYDLPGSANTLLNIPISGDFRIEPGITSQQRIGREIYMIAYSLRIIIYHNTAETSNYQNTLRLIMATTTKLTSNNIEAGVIAVGEWPLCAIDPIKYKYKKDLTYQYNVVDGLLQDNTYDMIFKKTVKPKQVWIADENDPYHFTSAIGFPHVTMISNTQNYSIDYAIQWWYRDQ